MIDPALVALAGWIVAACSSDPAGPKVPEPDAAPIVDAGPHGGDAAAERDAGSPKLGKCGDIEPSTTHAPLAAIQKLATSTNEVRILVYGQSISQQEWWTQVRDWIKATYPNGNLVMETHARGACGADCLIGRTAWFQDQVTENRLPADVFAWHPDLVLFHVYGADDDYESVVKGFSEGCSGFAAHPSSTVHCRPDQVKASVGYKKPEVLLQTDHQRAVTYPKIEPGFEFLQTHNETFVPAMATKYGFVMGDIYHAWATYLDGHGKDPNALLADGLHLNAAGNALMAALIERELCYKPLP